MTIDGEPANVLPRNNSGDAFIALTSARRESVIDLILAADGLSEGRHTAIITHRPELGDDQYPIAGFAVGNSSDSEVFPRRMALSVMILGIMGVVITGFTLPWWKIRLPSPSSLRNIGDFLLGLLFSAIVMVGTILTWHETLVLALRRDLPTILAALGTSTLLYYAPSTWIALMGMMIMGVIIFSRPLVGILQVIFWSAFFASTIDPFFRVLSVVEVMLVVTFFAVLARLLYDFAQREEKSLSKLLAVRLHPLDWTMLALMTLGMISLLWSDLLPEAVRELRVMLIEPSIFYFIIRLLKPDRRDLAFIVETLIFTGFLLAAIGIYTFITETSVVIAEGGTRRLISVYGSPN
ncbi:MAG TPA: hypothetical protein VJZ27_14730, partial [Aggregatilineales bacterium]|nr:hypothetical protein [Aggregatilineales bacterium]